MSADAEARPVTSYDVAVLAGVTQPTVSRAMRGERVAEATRLRVLAAAASLGYVPREAGRSLATRRTNRVGLVVADLQNAFYRGVISSFEGAMTGSGRQVLLFRDTDDDALLAQLSAGGIDGVALTATLIHSTLPQRLTERGIPTVLLNRATSAQDVDTCVSDNLLGSQLIASRLLDLGHRTIGAVFGPADTSTGRDRARGFRDRLAEDGVALHPRFVREVDYSHAAGHAAMIDIMSQPTTPTAVFCANDLLAIGAINATRRMGLSVPNDVSIIGYDDMEMSAWEVFDLTTVRQDIDSMSSQAAAMLTARIADPALPPRTVVIEPRLVVRSTDAPPGA